MRQARRALSAQGHGNAVGRHDATRKSTAGSACCSRTSSAARRSALKEHFVLQKIAEVEKIEIDDDDIDAEIERIAARERRVAAQGPGPAGEGRPARSAGHRAARTQGPRPDPGQRRVRGRAADAQPTTMPPSATVEAQAVPRRRCKDPTARPAKRKTKPREDEAVIKPTGDVTIAQSRAHLRSLRSRSMHDLTAGRDALRAAGSSATATTPASGR